MHVEKQAWVKRMFKELSSIYKKQQILLELLDSQSKYGAIMAEK